MTRESAHDASRLVGPHGDLDPVPGAEPAHEAGEVCLDSAEADVDLVGDLSVGQAMGHGEEHLLVPRGERFDGLSRGQPRSQVSECRQQADRDVRGDERFTVGSRVDRRWVRLPLERYWLALRTEVVLLRPLLPVRRWWRRLPTWVASSSSMSSPSTSVALSLMGTPPTPTYVLGSGVYEVVPTLLWCRTLPTSFPALIPVVVRPDDVWMVDPPPPPPPPPPTRSMLALAFAALKCASTRGPSYWLRSHHTVAFCLRRRATYDAGCGDMFPERDEMERRMSVVVGLVR